MAVHYYDEDDVTIGEPINGQVVVNHHIELTEEEKQEAKEKAIAQYQAQELAKLNKLSANTKKAVKKQDNDDLFQGSLF